MTATARFNELIQATIIKWIKAYNGYSIKTIIAEEQRFNAKKPIEGDFISYRFNLLEQNGHDEGTFNQDTQKIDYYGQRDFAFSMTIYAFNAMAIASNLISSLNLPIVNEILGEAKLGFSDVQCKNISGILDSGYEQRASIDINFHTALEYTDESSNYIEQLEFTSQLNDEKGKVLEGAFTVDLRED